MLPYHSMESAPQCLCGNVPDGAAKPEHGPRMTSREFLLSGLEHRDLEYGTSFQDTLNREKVTSKSVNEIVVETLRLDHGQALGMMPMERYLSEVGHWTPLCMGERGFRESSRKQGCHL
jgi:hypothetical protein